MIIALIIFVTLATLIAACYVAYRIKRKKSFDEMLKVIMADPRLLDFFQQRLRAGQRHEAAIIHTWMDSIAPIRAPRQ